MTNYLSASEINGTHLIHHTAYLDKNDNTEVKTSEGARIPD